MLIITENGELNGCIDQGTNYCNRCVWNNPKMTVEIGECPKRKKYNTMGHFLNSYLRTCSRCKEIYGCRIIGTNFSIERVCQGCPEYLRDCKMPELYGQKVEGHCIECNAIHYFEDDD